MIKSQAISSAPHAALPARWVWQGSHCKRSSRHHSVHKNEPDPGIFMAKINGLLTIGGMQNG